MKAHFIAAQLLLAAVAVDAQAPAGWTYSACYVDSSAARILRNAQASSTTLTIESCIATCTKLGWTVAGMQNGNVCWCDNALNNGAAVSTPDATNCKTACTGNSAQKCGGASRMSVYYTGSSLTIYPKPTPQKTTLDGNWKYVGCLMDPGKPQKALPWKLNFPTNNSAEVCLGQCAKFGYMAAGMEYGTECYCGDQMDIALVSGATLTTETDCKIVCPGDRRYLCGAGQRISYYNWVGPPLYTFGYPSGNAAGAYKFLIGGPTIPLITQAAINGKVTFLEKVGTGPGNDTGAYELDLMQLDNFTAAWRPMSTKTDVFCSASITLPDKAGRQLNIGGWSKASTFGVRIYWPDGSPGTWGKNDWQENVQALSLQQGRWYPTAMIMSNGSVLIVGGQIGSGGKPVPTLEILPKTGPTVYLDFLNRTDPYNLYPFLAVLPTGGIFIQYYNEALVMDEKTFATVKTLPYTPAAVNDPKGGRTYPLEGTTMLMPQYAPYTDPLAILVCGGSTIGAHYALDNCVTIKPEESNPQWVLERMPSKRVISCMTALPDGTYLILNGALQGVAGFALANNPNYNAVLYDPSKPVGARMSVMANTTVARMYHSEAILLQDGRVLVSGSDPQDPDYPQEYRVEVFVPPYLMGNPVRPTFSVASTDWEYGASVSFTTTVHQGPVRVSLLGGESSTHGNTMGQRTLFPAVSCSGSTCTLTAPPNNRVCPPGWYQMFVLDGPTPSVGTYVRIGGDPAKVGNWPVGPDFKLPGV